MAAPAAPRHRTRGEIETLPSGALRVRVYAGIDPLTKKRHYLTETVPAGPQAAREAEKARTRLLAQVDDRRNARTRATVNQLLDRYLEVLDVGATTRPVYERYIRKHIRPLLGTLSVGRVDGEVLESFYAQLRSAAPTAVAVGSPSIAPLPCTSAMNGAGRTSAGRWRLRRCGRYTRS